MPLCSKGKNRFYCNGRLTKAYFAVNNSSKTVFNSASGGVFSAITDTYCKGDFIIFGVQFDNKTNVIHSYTDSLDGARKYRKSKYVQSDIGESYKDAERFLKSGKKVLFTGTLCQIAGLRLYLRKEYENLFCLDLVCHGVPNQNIFDIYIRYIENKYKGEVDDFQFRHKTMDKSGKWNSRNVKIKIATKEIIMSSVKDKYLKGYHSGLFYRPSCYNCKYANPNRISDITMADFWGVEKLFQEDVHKGVSVITVNTKKGQDILNRLTKTMDLREVELEYVIKSNGQLNRPAAKHPKREQFFELLDKVGFASAVDTCIPKPPLIKQVASKVLPQKVKNAIKKIIR